MSTADTDRDDLQAALDAMNVEGKTIAAQYVELSKRITDIDLLDLATKAYRAGFKAGHDQGFSQGLKAALSNSIDDLHTVTDTLQSMLTTLEGTQKQYQQDPLTPLFDLPLGIRLVNSLNGYGYYTLGDIVAAQTEQLLSLRGIGVSRINKLRQVLEHAGYPRPDLYK